METDPQRAAGVAVCNLMAALLPNLAAMGLPPQSIIVILNLFDNLNAQTIASGPLLDALKTGTRVQRLIQEEIVKQS